MRNCYTNRKPKVRKSNFRDFIRLQSQPRQKYRSRPTYIDTLKRDLADVTKQFDQLLAQDLPALNESPKAEGQQPIEAPPASKVGANDGTRGSGGAVGASVSFPADFGAFW
jgi:hypothetical protein